MALRLRLQVATCAASVCLPLAVAMGYLLARTSFAGKWLVEVLIDLPLCVGTTGSLAIFYGVAEEAQGRKAAMALWRLPALIALGVGMAPHLTKAVWDGMQSMSGEFVRTPKKGAKEGRYRAYASLPMTEMGLGVLSAFSVIASIQTGHWFATPFAAMFTFGYGYVAALVILEQTARRRLVAAQTATVRVAG